MSGYIVTVYIIVYKLFHFTIRLIDIWLFKLYVSRMNIYKFKMLHMIFNF